MSERGRWLGGWPVLLSALAIALPWWGAFSTAQAQAQGLQLERGVPPVRVHAASSFQPPTEFQNMAVQRLADGRVVVANTSAMVLFDGARWRSYPHPRGLGTLWSVVPYEDRFYVGFSGDIGWFEPDGAGGYRYQSALEWLPPAQREFGTVWSAVGSRDGIWFSAGSQTMLLDPSTRSVRVWPTVRFGVFLYAIGDEVWLNDRGVGLLRSVGSGAQLRLEAIAGGESFKGMPILGVARMRDGDVIVGSSAGELYRYRDGQVSRFAEALWPQLVENGVQTVLGLADGTLAIGFLNSGPWVIDADGRVLERYGDAEGVPPLTTFLLHEDAHGTLWVAQNQNVVEIARGSGHTRFDRHRGIPDANSLHRHQDRFYAGGLSGWYRLRPDHPQGTRFERYSQGPRNIWAMASAGDWLYVAGRGLERYRMTAEGDIAEVQSVVRMQFGKSVTRSIHHSDRLYFAGTDGAAILDGASSAAPQISEVALDGSPVFVAESDPDTFWVSDQNGRFWRVFRDATGWQREVFDASHGVLDGETMPVRGADRPWFLAVSGPMDFDAATRRFAPARDWPAGAPRVRMEMLLDTGEQLWLRADGRSGRVHKAAPQQFDTTPFQGSDDRSQVTAFLQEDQVLWVARSDGVQRIELDRALAPPEVAPSVQQVWDPLAGAALPLTEPLSLPADRRDVRIDYALPAALRSDATTYRSRLLGNDADWSEFSPAATRTWTNLPDGPLHFELQARDAFGRLSPITRIGLVVAAPWYRTPVAWAGYLAAATLALWLAMRLGARRRQRQMQARQTELEATVAARTAELNDKNVQLAEQAERLQTLDRLKTDFFVNIGHEFRTPLTLVLGPLDDVLRDARTRLGERTREQLELALRNARRVLALIVELLDVNRLEQGHLPLKPVQAEFQPWLRGQLGELQTLVDRHGHRLHLQLDEAPIRCAFDPVLLARVLTNLIGNACKFMPRGGLIEVSLRGDGEQLLLGVRDHGSGIAAGELPHIFDRFHRVPGGSTEGYGVGLALAREIIERHGGRIWAESTLGTGTCIQFSLPLGRSQDSLGASMELRAASDNGGIPPASSAPLGDPHTLAALSNGAPQTPPALSLSKGDPQAHGADELPAHPPTRARPRVLVVDDHEDLRLRLQQLLDSRYEVLVASDGPQALALAQQQLPDVIVSDVMMPGFDGVELTRRVRAQGETRSIGILLLTAKAGAEHAVVGLQAGANDYLAKPFDAAELLARVAAILAHARRLQLQLARSTAPAPTPLPPREAADARWLQRLEQHIDARLHDSDFDVEALAAAMHLERSALFRHLKQHTAQGPADLLRERRLLRAEALLKAGAGSVTEVAFAVGFDTLSGFTRAFRARFGQPPSALLPRAG